MPKCHFVTAAGTDCKINAPEGETVCVIHKKKLLGEEKPMSEEDAVRVADTADPGIAGGTVQTDFHPQGVPEEIANAEAYALRGGQKPKGRPKKKSNLDAEALAHKTALAQVAADRKAKQDRLMARGDIGKTSEGPPRQPYGVKAYHSEYIHDPTAWVDEKGKDLRKPDRIYRQVRTMDHHDRQTQAAVDLFKRYGGEVTLGKDGKPAMVGRDTILMDQPPEGYVEKVRHHTEESLPSREDAEEGLRESVRGVNRAAGNRVLQVVATASHGRMEAGRDFDDE